MLVKKSVLVHRYIHGHVNVGRMMYSCGDGGWVTSIGHDIFRQTTKADC